jgi:alpha-ketoglutarate-dependent taurine dioxygenase
MSDLREIHIEEQKTFNNLSFPLVLSPNEEIKSIEETIKYIENDTNKKYILDKLLQHGAILFRGFPVVDAKDFNEFSLAFGWEDLPYIGGAAPRSNVIGVVFTSNESPPDQPIPFHHEMAQVPKFPSNLFFFCEIPAKEGGETPLCLSNLVYERINIELPEFVQQLREKGVKYTRILPNGDDSSSAIGRGWQSTFLTNDKKEAEEKCKSQGGECEWLDDGCLKTVSKILPAIRFDERTGKETWFNSIVAAYIGWKDSRNVPEKAVTFGDDTPLDGDIVRKCNEILQESCVSFKWQQGDVVLVDNKLVLHARKTFVPPRRILASLFQ